MRASEAASPKELRRGYRGGSGVHWVETLTEPHLHFQLEYVGILEVFKNTRTMNVSWQSIKCPPPTGNYGRLLWLDVLLMARLLSSLLPSAAQRARNQVKMKILEPFPM